MNKNWILVATLFSGHESQMMAAEMAINGSNLPIEAKLVLWSDNDPKVRAIHNLVYPEYENCCNPDVTKIDWGTVSEVDLLIYSSPCQSVSRSGKRKGIKKGSGTESALLWSVEKAIATKRPKCCIMENVAGMLDPDFQPDFIKWTRTLSSYGYVSYYKVLSSAEYGIPQNRERLFLVSFRIDDKANIPSFNWPEPVALTVKPEDLLDDAVDDKYYLDEQQVATFIDILKNAVDGYETDVIYPTDVPTKYLSSQFDRKVSATVAPLRKNGAIPTLMASNSQGGSLVTMTDCRREGTACVVEVWEGHPDLLPVNMPIDEITHQHITAQKKCRDRHRVLNVLDNLAPNQYFRVRRLTPEEAMRFMGVDQRYIDRIVRPKDVYSESEVAQLTTIDGKRVYLHDADIYGRAGNSIVVHTLAALLTQVFKTLTSSAYSTTDVQTSELSPLEKKRLAARNYYLRHREEVCRKSREYHRTKRNNNQSAA